MQKQTTLMTQMMGKNKPKKTPKAITSTKKAPYMPKIKYKGKVYDQM